MPMGKGYKSRGCCGHEGPPGKGTSKTSSKVSFTTSSQTGGILSKGQKMLGHRGKNR